MAAAKGRSLLIKKGSTVLAGMRTKGVAINGEPIDITSDDDSGYRTLLSDVGTLSVDLSIEGITKDDTLKALILAGGTSLMLTDITVEYPDGKTLDGDFFLASLEETGAYNEAVTFSGSLQSSGAWTYGS
jgi:predicted secreted protein